MKGLLRLAGHLDSIVEGFALVVRWGLLANALLITGNALSRKLFAVALPTAFDLQWHFLAAVVLLMAAYAFQRDEHVRIDLFAARLGERGMAWLDLVGIVFVVLPVCATMIWVSAPDFARSLLSGETRATRESVSALPAWIIKSFVPAGFMLLGLQALAEAIRCVASLQGVAPRPVPRRYLAAGPSRDG